MFTPDAMGEKLRQARKSAGVSQNYMAARLGITPAYMGHLEHGRRIISMEMMVLICNELGVSPDLLLSHDLPQELIPPEYRDPNYLLHLMGLLEGEPDLPEDEPEEESAPQAAADALSADAVPQENAPAQTAPAVPEAPVQPELEIEEKPSRAFTPVPIPAWYGPEEDEYVEDEEETRRYLAWLTENPQPSVPPMDSITACKAYARGEVILREYIPSADYNSPRSYPEEDDLYSLDRGRQAAAQLFVLLSDGLITTDSLDDVDAELLWDYYPEDMLESLFWFRALDAEAESEPAHLPAFTELTPEQIHGLTSLLNPAGNDPYFANDPPEGPPIEPEDPFDFMNTWNEYRALRRRKNRKGKNPKHKRAATILNLLQSFPFPDKK